MTLSHACCADLALVRTLEGPIYAASQHTPHPLRRGRANPLFESKGPTQTKETMAMKNLFLTIRKMQRRNSAVKLLNRMDDRMLDDIGITRRELSQPADIFH